MDNQTFESFIRSIYQNLYWFTQKNASLYICHATMVTEFDNVLRDFDWSINNKICWVKDIPTYTMAKYKWQYEPIYFVLKGDPVFNVDRTETNVWQIKAIQSAGSIDDNGRKWFDGGAKNLTLHPTQKPVELSKRAINNSTKCNQLVLDLFGGSGSTLIACEKTNRKCFMSELEPLYIDVIIKRWEEFTGKKAVKL